MTEFEVVIGIEVHAQLKTKTKLFSTAANNFGDDVNTNVTPVCLGMPGALPVLNKKAVEFAITAGLALDCEINLTSVFSRKNYFYPDLPKGYQISQFDLPICGLGHLDIDVDGVTKRIGITRIHMEEDAGKLLHQGADGIAGSTHSLVDLNRAGTPLIEIVSEPDMRSASEAKAYMVALREIVQHMGVCDGNMDQGSMRADANVSIRPVGQKEFGTRAEVKNLNSFRSLERAINVEVKRQKALILSGGTVIQETRNYDDATQSTTSLRGKADAHDYRYFPEPDLPPLIVTQDWFKTIKEALPEHPVAKRERYASELGLSQFEIKVLMGDIETDTYFNAAILVNTEIAPKEICKWVVGDINALLKETESSFSKTKLSSAHLAEMVDLILKGTISGKMAKDMIGKMAETGDAPGKLVDSMGGAQISDEGALLEAVKAVLDANLDVIEKIKNGKKQAAGFLMGQVMKATKGKAKPDLVSKLIFEEVEKR